MVSMPKKLHIWVTHMFQDSGPQHKHTTYPRLDPVKISFRFSTSLATIFSYVPNGTIEYLQAPTWNARRFFFGRGNGSRKFTVCPKKTTHLGLVGQDFISVGTRQHLNFWSAALLPGIPVILSDGFQVPFEAWIFFKVVGSELRTPKVFRD